MAKLTKTQHGVLAVAAARADGAATPPVGLNKAAMAKVAASLVARGLLREARAKVGMPVWSQDARGRGVGLILTKAGRATVGAATDADPDQQKIPRQPIAGATVRDSPRSGAPQPAAQSLEQAKSRDEAGGAKARGRGRGSSRRQDMTVDAASQPCANGPSDDASANTGERSAGDRTPAIAAAPRAGSKQALIIAMLARGDGATIGALVEATGWLPHTTRAALTGLRKRGFSVERSRDGAKASLYRIVAAPKPSIGA